MEEIVRETVSLGVMGALAGHFRNVMYWIEGMPGWHNLWFPEMPGEVCYSDRPAVIGEDMSLVVWWFNDSDVSMVGHVDITLTSPTGVAHTPAAIANQDVRSDPHGGGAAVEFAPVTMDEAGTWTLEMVLLGGRSPQNEIARAKAKFAVGPAEGWAERNWKLIALLAGLGVVGYLAIKR